MKAYWVVAGGKRGEVGHCQRCGEGLVMMGNQLIEVVTASMKAYVNIHKNCKDTDAGRKGERPLTPRDWMQGRDTGISSMTICCTIAGFMWPMHHYPDVPHNPSDFGRCYRFLNLFPDFKPQLHKVAERFPEWIPFVREWDKLTEMYEVALASKAKTAPVMYQFMKELEKEAVA